MVSNNDRLNPGKLHTRHYILTQLRESLENLFQKHLASQHEALLLDYGCGSKPYLPVLEASIDYYIGADFYGNPVADLYFGNEGKLPVKCKCIDYVLSTQVLEHVSNVNAYLAECRRVLKDGGTLLLTTHGTWQYHPHPTDYWRWTKDGLIMTLARNGFHVEEIKGIVGPTAYGLQLIQDSYINRKLPRFLRPTLIRIFQRLMAFADHNTTPEQVLNNACIYIVVATKGSS